MNKRFLGLPEELRLELEQGGGIDTEEARVIINESVQQTEDMIDKALRELQEVIGPHGSVTRLQAGGVRITQGGIGIYSDGVLKTTILQDGNLFVGSNISEPETTTMCCFVNDQVYNNEEMGAGDLLIGDNTAANLFYDASEGRLNFRNGTTVNVYVDTDGVLKAGGGVVTLDDDGVSVLVPDLAVTSPSSFKYVDASGNVIGALQIYTSVAGTKMNMALQTINAGSITSGLLAIGTPKTTIQIDDTTSTIKLNPGRADIDTSIEWDSGTSVFVDGGTGKTYIDYGLQVNGSYLDKDTVISGDTEDDIIVDASADTVYIGGATNAVKIAKGGELTLIGTATRFDDLRIEPVVRAAGVNAPSFEKWLDDAGGTSRGVYLYSFDDAVGGSEKELHFTMQLPHAWKEGSAISIHVHWIGAVDDTTADPRWGLEYAWKDIGAVFGDTTIVYSDGTHISAPATPDANVTAFKHYITEFADLTPDTTQDNFSSILIGRLFRDSANGGDTYNATGAKVGLLYIDAHYEIDSFGSAQEYVK